MSLIPFEFRFLRVKTTLRDDFYFLLQYCFVPPFLNWDCHQQRELFYSFLETIVSLFYSIAAIVVPIVDFL